MILGGKFVTRSIPLFKHQQGPRQVAAAEEVEQDLFSSA